MMRASDHEIIGREFRDIWPEEFRPTVDACVSKVLKGERCAFDAYRMNGPEKGWWRVSLNPLFDNGGSVYRFIAISTDITEHIQGEEKDMAERERLIGELREAVVTIKTLQGILPICSSCKKIRDDKGYWRQMEKYITEHSSAKFSHSICPDCAKKIYPDYYEKLFGGD